MTAHIGAQRSTSGIGSSFSENKTSPPAGIDPIDSFYKAKGAKETTITDAAYSCCNMFIFHKLK
jgi:hypothetical protein